MEKVDPTPEGNADDATAEENAKDTVEETYPNGDPLDDIEDETERAKQKEIRAIHNRNKKKVVEEVKPEKKEEKPQGDYLTVDDFHLANTNKAKELAKANYPEIVENWDDIISFAPSVNKEVATPDDILMSMRRGLAAWGVDKDPTKADDPTADLKTTTGQVGTGGGVTPKTEKKDPPNFALPKGPDTWYPDPNKKE